MCGIIGYIGKKEAAPVLIDGLKKLEYRGYDSAGIAVFCNGSIKTEKVAGRIKNLEKIIKNTDLKGNFGIGHTRWATHGQPTQTNAHPHCDCQGKIWLVHNGIIENYKELKEKLEKEGHCFRSETDTEVIAHLIENQKLKIKNKKYILKNQEGQNSKTLTNIKLEDAAREALKQVRGTYGLAVISVDEPQKIVVARESSPLLIGLGRGGKEFFIASDATPLLSYTKKVIYLDDREIATITPKGIKIKKIDGKTRRPIPQKIEWSQEFAQKEGFPHFMLKEIFEEAETVKNSLRGRVLPQKNLIKLGGLESAKEELKKTQRILTIGCGTAYLAGLSSSYLFEELGFPTESFLASEFRYKNPVLTKKTTAIIISQSGETADTLAALRLINSRGLLSLGVVNVVGSTISRETKAGVYCHIGPEIAVASTKAFVSQLSILTMMALYIAELQNRIEPEFKKRISRELTQLPEKINALLGRAEQIKKLARKYKNFDNFLYLGRKYNYPTALEGALKLKEVSYVHAEGYAAGEMKHGPIALVDKNFPTLAIATKNSVYEKVLSNIEEVRARKGPIIALATEGDKQIKSRVDDVVYVPKTLEPLEPILNVIPLQLFAYWVGTMKGYDVDKPRNLAKSVTVE